jgi:hypothetical protein
MDGPTRGKGIDLCTDQVASFVAISGITIDPVFYVVLRLRSAPL